MLAAATLLVQSCTPFHFTEQFDAADREYPVAICAEAPNLPSPFDYGGKKLPEHLCLYKGQHYLPLALAYATRSTSIIGGDHHYRFTDKAPQVFYFPLSDEEVDKYLERSRGSTKQPPGAAQTRVIPQADFPWRQATQIRFNATVPWQPLPASARMAERSDLARLGTRQSEYLPIKGGERGVLNYIGMGLASPFEQLGNATATVLAVPTSLLALTFYHGLAPGTWDWMRQNAEEQQASVSTESS